MKNTAIILFLTFSFFFIGWQSKTAFNSNKIEQETRNEIQSLITNHGQLVYEAFFDLTDIRPFSILQNDETIELYNNHWISSKDYLSKLNIQDLSKLKEKMVDFIQSKEESNRTSILYKINSWCVNQKQFNQILKEFKINNNKLLKAIYENDITKSSFDKFTKGSNWSIDKLSEDEKTEILHLAINAITELSQSEVLMFHSKIFSSLSTMAVK